MIEGFGQDIQNQKAATIIYDKTKEIVSDFSEKIFGSVKSKSQSDESFYLATDYKEMGEAFRKKFCVYFECLTETLSQFTQNLDNILVGNYRDVVNSRDQYEANSKIGDNPYLSRNRKSLQTSLELLPVLIDGIKAVLDVGNTSETRLTFAPGNEDPSEPHRFRFIYEGKTYFIRLGLRALRDVGGLGGDPRIAFSITPSYIENGKVMEESAKTVRVRLDYARKRPDDPDSFTSTVIDTDIPGMSSLHEGFLNGDHHAINFLDALFFKCGKEKTGPQVAEDETTATIDNPPLNSHRSYHVPVWEFKEVETTKNGRTIKTKVCVCESSTPEEFEDVVFFMSNSIVEKYNEGLRNTF